jgi:hypothetical protein
MVRAHLAFRPRFERAKLAERYVLLVLYKSVCTAQKQLLLAPMGLDHLYYSGDGTPSASWRVCPLADQRTPESAHPC